MELWRYPHFEARHVFAGIGRCGGVDVDAHTHGLGLDAIGLHGGEGGIDSREGDGGCELQARRQRNQAWLRAEYFAAGGVEKSVAGKARLEEIAAKCCRSKELGVTVGEVGGKAVDVGIGEAMSGRRGLGESGARHCGGDCGRARGLDAHGGGGGVVAARGEGVVGGVVVDIVFAFFGGDCHHIINKYGAQGLVGEGDTGRMSRPMGRNTTRARPSAPMNE